MVFCIRSFARCATILLAFSMFALPVAVRGEGAQRTAPPYARETDADVVHGTITWFDGRYALQLRDDRGFFDNVQLFQGTVIHPTGQRLQPGMRVAVRGANRGFALIATQIDTPDPQAPATAAAAVPAAAPAPVHAAPVAQGRHERRMQEYRAQQEAYRHARAAATKAQEAANRAAAQRLAQRLERLYGKHPRKITAVHHAPRRTHAPKITRARPVPAPRPSLHPVAVVKHPKPAQRHTAAAGAHVAKTAHRAAKPPLPLRLPINDVANRHDVPPWFGWGKL